MSDETNALLAEVDEADRKCKELSRELGEIRRQLKDGEAVLAKAMAERDAAMNRLRAAVEKAKK